MKDASVNEYNRGVEFIGHTLCRNEVYNTVQGEDTEEDLDCSLLDKS